MSNCGDFLICITKMGLSPKTNPVIRFVPGNATFRQGNCPEHEQIAGKKVLPPIKHGSDAVGNTSDNSSNLDQWSLERCPCSMDQF